MEILDSFVWKFNVLNGSDKKNSVGLIMTGRTGWKNTKKCETWESCLWYLEFIISAELQNDDKQNFIFLIYSPSPPTANILDPVQ